MGYIPIKVPPGIVKAESDYAEMGRWIDCDKIRFVRGSPEKIGGILRLSGQTFTGYARGAIAWTAYEGGQYLAFGTQDDLYAYYDDTITDITPFRADATGITLTNPFATTNGSAVVTVTDNTHGIAAAGVKVVFSGATAVGGITINGTYSVTSIVDANTYRITHTSNATSTVASGGGTVTASYEINPGDASLEYLSGWGAGSWGSGGWGAPVSLTASAINEPRWWTFGTYGEDLMICPLDGVIYYFDTSGGITRPAVLANGPAQVRCMFVTPERFVVALGCTNSDGVFDAMTVRWPDQTDPTEWTVSDTNTAEDRKLQGGTRLMGGAGITEGLSLIWSDTSVFTMQYTGSGVVYDTRMNSTNCGLVGPHAMTTANASAYWMSKSGFYVFNGSTNRIPNQLNILQWVIDNMDEAQLAKVCCYHNSEHNEVWWIFPTLSGDGEPDTYVHVNLETYEWAKGTLSRSAICLYPTGERRPIMFGYDGYLYAHEDLGDSNDNGSPMEAYITMALFDLEQGNTTSDIWSFIPDFQRQAGDISVYIYGKEYPRGETVSSATITISATEDKGDCHVSGRQIGLTITSNTDGGDFRLGKFGVDINAAGRRK